MILPFISKRKKTFEIILDPTDFEEGKLKIIRIWSWKNLKRIAYVVSFKEGKFFVKKFT